MHKTNMAMTKTKDLRNRCGFSQEELAEKSGLSLRTIQRIENGDTNPRGDSLRRLAAALETSPDELTDRTVAKDSSFLNLMLLSSLSFLIFPILGIIVPLVIWLIKKDRTAEHNNAAKTIIGFEILWNAALFIVSGIIVLSTFIRVVETIDEVSPSMVTGYLHNISLSQMAIYSLNMVFIAANFFRLQRGKDIRIWPFGS